MRLNKVYFKELMEQKYGGASRTACEIVAQWLNHDQPQHASRWTADMVLYLTDIRHDDAHISEEDIECLKKLFGVKTKYDDLIKKW